MNLSEERNYQKRMEVLEALKLTPVNRQIAEEYLDMTRPEQPELLKKAEHQDFFGLSKDSGAVYRTYVEHLRKRERQEESARFMRLVAAVGGSSAGFFLGNITPWTFKDTESTLRSEQVLAIRAEMISRNIYLLRRCAILESTAAERNPSLYLMAMNQCWCKDSNGKLLLAAAYLYTVKPSREDGRNTAGAGHWDKCSAGELSVWLMGRMVDCIPALFGGSLPSSEFSQLSRFVRESAPEEPFSEAVSSILNNRQYSEYMLTYLSSIAFLAVDHSERFLVFLRLLMAVSLSKTLDTCVGTTIQRGTWFERHMKRLEQAMPAFLQNEYICWCIKAKASDALRRMAAGYPEKCRRVLERLSMEDYQFFMKQIRSGNPALYKELSASQADTVRFKLADELTSAYTIGKAEARQYLLGEAELDQVMPFVSSWQDNASRYRWNTTLFVSIRQVKAQGEALAQMYRRALVLEGLSRRAGYFCNNYCWRDNKNTYAGNRDLTRKEIDEILGIFTEEELPVSAQLDILSCIHDGYWQEKTKTNFINESVHAVARRCTEWESELLKEAQNGSAVVRFLCVRVLDFRWEDYKETLLACAGDSSKQVRELLQAVYASHRTWEPEIKEMLVSKKSQEREMAALVLKAWGTEGFREELTAALEKEKSKKLQELLQGILGIQTEGGSAPAAPKELTAEQTAAALLKGGKKRKVAWAFPLCEVHKKDGQAVSEDYLAALFIAYADMGTAGVSREARMLAGELNEQELAACVTQLYDKWLEGGAEAKKKWVLYAFSLHGGEGMVNVLYRQIQEWPKNARGAMACEAVRALALNGSSTALLLVDQISRKFKFRQVKTAAGEALAAAAGQLGISREELEDRIVPNLGFGEDLSQTFDYGPRHFRVVLTPTLELSITDETGKKLKNLPAPGKRDDEEKARAASDAFKSLKKQLKTVTANQKLRLEQALGALRLWSVPRWQELFVKNPVMHQFAIGLIWGRYEDGRLAETFRYMEDGSFNTVDEEEYTLPEDGLIGLAHPIELSEEDLAAWKEQLSDYEVTQPIPQLERQIYRVTEEEREATELARFGGILISGLSLSGRLQGLGWYRGSVQDGGGFYTFYREDGDLGVELEFSGMFVGGEYEEVTVYGVSFYRAGTVKRGSYVYDRIKKENQYKLGEVPPRYFSEIVIQLTHATSGSEERVPYPDCKK